jgi:hypothetical protein
MSVQQNPSVYAAAIQYTLTQTVNPVKVYANFNRNFATEPKFLTWQLRNIHQDVYTGQTQSNKGIDRPVFQVSIFAQSMTDAFSLSNTVLQSLHGYSGNFGTAPNQIWVAKCDVVWLYNTYDNELGLNQIILDCTLDIPT